MVPLFLVEDLFLRDSHQSWLDVVDVVFLIAPNCCNIDVLKCACFALIISCLIFATLRSFFVTACYTCSPIVANRVDKLSQQTSSQCDLMAPYAIMHIQYPWWLFHTHAHTSFIFWRVCAVQGLATVPTKPAETKSMHMYSMNAD